MQRSPLYPRSLIAPSLITAWPPGFLTFMWPRWCAPVSWPAPLCHLLTIFKAQTTYIERPLAYWSHYIISSKSYTIDRIKAGQISTFQLLFSLYVPTSRDKSCYMKSVNSYQTWNWPLFRAIFYRFPLSTLSAAGNLKCRVLPNSFIPCQFHLACVCKGSNWQTTTIIPIPQIT